MGSNTALAMPNAPEEVTLGWLQTIFGDKTISSFTITEKRLFETSSKLYITLAYEGDDDANAAKPRHILLKGGFNPAMFAIPGYKPLLLGAYTREVDFFTRYARTLPADIGIHLPKVWWAAASPDQAILAMEDLGKSGFEFGDPTRTYGLASVLNGVEQLAALHVRTWGWTTQEHPWLAAPMYDDTMRGLLAMWDELILGEGRPPLPGVIRDDRARTSRALEAYFSTRNPRFRSLLHGDPHSGNTYHRAGDETDVRFLDWQITHIGSVFHDVAYFAVGMLAVEERRAREWEVVEHYLKAVARLGGLTLSVDDPEVRAEYRKAQMTGLGWILTPYAMQKEERVRAMVERYATSIADHRTIELLTGEEEAATGTA
ncbi:hypothetical protein NKR19_g8696 [Coniochaeta hoffmannii]|uniref:CHK kinase-like domain-containing protein n=1 Tax=Coniochaeta hoffmannii TaxID=91930 RepID=A0AA38R5L6_9PEZI|nr:hypothetical protein NKR19_g8696 [Coniochaeta hoffmannii]